MKPPVGSGGSYARFVPDDPDSLFPDTDGEREILEGLEGTSVQEKLIDGDFFNRFDDDFDEDDMALPK
eukprot:jgi/Chrzof1/7521/Cz02g26240.t1